MYNFGWRSFWKRQITGRGIRPVFFRGWEWDCRLTAKLNKDTFKEMGVSPTHEQMTLQKIYWGWTQAWGKSHGCSHHITEESLPREAFQLLPSHFVQKRMFFCPYGAVSRAEGIGVLTSSCPWRFLDTFNNGLKSMYFHRVSWFSPLSQFNSELFYIKYFHEPVSFTKFVYSLRSPWGS